MPTIVESGGFRMVIYPNDHAPPHVHVHHADGMARISLEAEPRLLSVRGLSAIQARRARSLVAGHWQVALKVWKKFHE